MEIQLLTLLQCVIYHENGNLIICYTVYCMSRLLNKNSYDRRLPYPLILDGLGGTPYKGSKYKVHFYFLAVNISFHVLDISRLKKRWCGWNVGGGGGVCMVGDSSPWPIRENESSHYRLFGTNPVLYSRPIEEWFSLSHDEISQPPPPFTSNFKIARARSNEMFP